MLLWVCCSTTTVVVVGGVLLLCSAAIVFFHHGGAANIRRGTHIELYIIVEKMKCPDQITLELKNIIYLIPNQHNCGCGGYDSAADWLVNPI